MNGLTCWHRREGAEIGGARDKSNLDETTRAVDTSARLSNDSWDRRCGCNWNGFGWLDVMRSVYIGRFVGFHWHFPIVDEQWNRRLSGR